MDLLLLLEDVSPLIQEASVVLCCGCEPLQSRWCHTIGHLRIIGPTRYSWRLLVLFFFCTEVLNAGDYHFKVTTLHSGTATYETLRRYPPASYINQVINYLQNLKDKVIDRLPYYWLTLENPSHASMASPRYTRKEHHTDPSAAASTQLPTT